MPTTTRASAGPDLVLNLTKATDAAEELFARGRASVLDRVCWGSEISSPKLASEQRAVHGLAWLATYVETIRQLSTYAERLSSLGRLGEIEEMCVRIGASEYLAQIVGGIPISQGEFVRPRDLGLTDADISAFLVDPVRDLITTGGTTQIRAALVDRMRAQDPGNIGDPGLDETLEAIRVEMRRFTDAAIIPNAHEWHLANAYIPIEIIEKLAELGVFALTIPEQYGGLGLGKESMCVVSEELSRGWIAVGSLGTRSEIAAELILNGGTDAQKEEWLPKIASGEILPTAVFTEPNTGSDLASLRTRAVREGHTYRVTGQKTWITHPVRADLMTLLVRTNPSESGYKGLSILLAEKPRGTDRNPFPAPGMSGSEIEVLGYRGMKEYDISFDGFDVKAENLLGGMEGHGFKQLMQTFESARIQTAARAIGVAQNALELGWAYSKERTQFGKAIISFPRVADKLAMMAAEILMTRQLTYYAARQKDRGSRCDIEAGMAKLLAARVAWAAADNSVQIHGGNGFALEFPVSRVLCDARILNIFEGAAEIQAQVIGRRILER